MSTTQRTPMRGYRVEMMNGPAKGWSYVTLIPPDFEIVLAPVISRSGEWFRLPYGESESWPGECCYRRVEAPSGMTTDGDIIIGFKVK